MKTRFSEKRTQDKDLAPKEGFEGRLSPVKSKLLLAQVSELLGSSIPDQRKEARVILLNMVLHDASSKAKAILHADCKKALAGSDAEERRLARKILGELAAKKDCQASKTILVSDHKNAIADFDHDAMVYLGMNGKKDISEAVDKALEMGMERLDNENQLDTLAYIAAMSGCSPQAKYKAAAVVAERERRTGNLGLIHDTCDDPRIQNLMKEAIARR